MTDVLVHGYAIRSATIDDAPGMYAVSVASDLADFGDASGYTVEEFADMLGEIDPARDTWIITSPDGNIVGTSYLRDRNHVRIDVEGFVHPDHTGHGVGTTLVRQSETRAREHIPLAPEGVRVVLQNWINGDNEDACALLEREGYTPFRYFFRMESSLTGELPAPQWMEGVSIRTCEDETDQRLMYETMEEAMADHWGFMPRSWDDWIGRHKRSSWDPSLWFLAMHDGEPVGGAICTITDGIGWVDDLGVRARARKQGLGMALLRHAAREFAGRGLTRMALGVDTESPTGATRLYERSGMHITRRHATYGKVLRDGREPAGED